MSEWLTVMAPAFYPSRDRVRYYLDSATRQGFVPHLYGIGDPFTGWIQTHVDRLQEELRSVRTPMVLVTDAADVIFGAGEAEIHQVWTDLGCPWCVMGVEADGQVNAGGWLAVTEALLEALGHVISPMKDGNPQIRWRHAVSAGDLTVSHDHGRKIFLVDTLFSGHLPESLPPVLHFPGGYSDPDSGRAYRMGPIFDRIYGAAT